MLFRSSFGGLAWDDRGTICLIVPAKNGKVALEVMKTAYIYQEIASDPAWNQNSMALAKVGYQVEARPFKVGSGEFSLNVRDLGFMTAASEPSWGTSSMEVTPVEGEDGEIFNVVLKVGEKSFEFSTKWKPVEEDSTLEARPPALVD